MKLFSFVCVVLLLFGGVNVRAQNIDGKTVTVPPVENPGFETYGDGLFLHWGWLLRVTRTGEYGNPRATYGDSRRAYTEFLTDGCRRSMILENRRRERKLGTLKKTER